MLLENTNNNDDNLQQHGSSIRQLKTNYILMKIKKILVFLLVFIAFAETQYAQKRPNVIIFTYDDLRPQIGAYGVTDVLTPNIDKLASEGTRFNSAYITYPLCLPSRSAMLTGIRFDNTSFVKKEELDQSEGKNALYYTMLRSQPTWPEVLHNAGYWTASRGKLYHENIPNFQKTHWDIPGLLYVDPGPYQIPEHLRNKVVDKGGVDKHIEHMMAGNHGPGDIAFFSIDCADNELHEGTVADDVVDYLLNKRDKSKPFAIAAGFSRPHLPWLAPKKYYDMYPEDAGQLAPIPQGKERIIEKKDFRGISSNTWNEGLTDSVAKRMVRAYMATVTYADAQMGRVIEALKKTGEYDNTIIVLWGDHGYMLSEHGLWQKNRDYRLNMRIPLIIKAPGYKAGQECNRIVQNTDIYPTLLKLCGIPKPNEVMFDGHDLSPLLKNPNAKWNDIAYVCCVGRYGAITDKYRFTDFGKGEYELYDIKNDPDEWVNLANNPKYKGVVDELKKKVDGTVWNKKQ